MTSRERLLCAMTCQEPDHVPLWNLWRSQEQPFDGRSPQRIPFVLDLGLDDMLRLEPPWGISPEVKVTCWEERSPEERYPHLCKVYETPRGPLKTVVRKSQDWPHGDDIPLFSDYNLPRASEFLVKGPEDLEKLAYVLGPPDDEQIAAFRERAQALRAFADEHQVLIEGGRIEGSDAAFWLCGVEPLLIAAVEQPDFVAKLLAFIEQWEQGRIELCLDVGVDIILRRGWYETPDLWSPRLFRQMIAPMLRREAALAHQGGAKFRYIMTMGIMAILEDFAEMGVDVLAGVDPVQGGADLETVKGRLADRVCIMGGMNAAITLGPASSKEDIRRAVGEAIRVMAPGGGFILYPVDQIFEDTPWRNVLALVECWREMGDYPIASPASTHPSGSHTPGYPPGPAN